MFGEGVLATDAFATFLSSPPVANCGGSELPVGGELREWRTAAVANSKSVESRPCHFVLKRKQEEAHPPTRIQKLQGSGSGLKRGDVA